MRQKDYYEHEFVTNSWAIWDNNEVEHFWVFYCIMYRAIKNFDPWLYYPLTYYVVGIGFGTSP